MEDDKINLNNIVRHFSPAWYASVMGTGGLANVLTYSRWNDKLDGYCRFFKIIESY